MNALKTAYKNEMFKISKKKKIIVAMSLCIAAAVGIGMIFSGINYLFGVKISAKGNFAMTMLPFLQYTLIPLFTAFICIDMFSGEYTNETIKLTLTRPVSRFKVYLSKVLAAATFIALFLLFALVLTTAISLFTDGFSLNVLKAVPAYIMAFVPLFIFALMVMIVSNFSRGSAGAFLLSIVIFIAFKVLEFVIPAYDSFLFTSHFDWYRLVSFYKIVRVFFIYLGYGILFFSFGCFLFERKSF